MHEVIRSHKQNWKRSCERSTSSESVLMLQIFHMASSNALYWMYEYISTFRSQQTMLYYKMYRQQFY